eukprot:1885181-Amphidinium_carterae.2
MEGGQQKQITFAGCQLVDWNHHVKDLRACADAPCVYDLGILAQKQELPSRLQYSPSQASL